VACRSAISAIGGGIRCGVPDLGARVAYAPPLNAAGNSLAGTEALERLATEAGLNVVGGKAAN